MAPSNSYLQLLRLWLPLAASWMLLAAELPLITFFLARMPQAAEGLAAVGGLVWPIMLFINSSGFMLLSAGTALSDSQENARRLRTFTILLSSTLTVVLLLFAAGPSYHFITERIIGAPPALSSFARVGFLLALPWPAAVAYRRYCQGVLIRTGRSSVVGWGSLVRLVGDLIVLSSALWLGWSYGIMAAASAVSVGLIAEAAFVHSFAARAAVERLPKESSELLSQSRILLFYLPLALTSLINLANPPLGSMAIFRLPFALESAAAWTAVVGTAFLFQSGVSALREVVLAELSHGADRVRLERFTLLVGALSSLALLSCALSPLGLYFFSAINGLEPKLASFAHYTLLSAAPMPLLGSLQSWFQANVIHLRKNNWIPQSVVLHFSAAASVMLYSIFFKPVAGLPVYLVAVQSGMLVQISYLRLRLSVSR